MEDVNSHSRIIGLVNISIYSSLNSYVSNPSNVHAVYITNLQKAQLEILCLEASCSQLHNIQTLSKMRSFGRIRNTQTSQFKQQQFMQTVSSAKKRPELIPTTPLITYFHISILSIQPSNQPPTQTPPPAQRKRYLSTMSAILQYSQGTTPVTLAFTGLTQYRTTTTIIAPSTLLATLSILIALPLHMLCSIRKVRTQCGTDLLTD